MPVWPLTSDILEIGEWQSGLVDKPRDPRTEESEQDKDNSDSDHQESNRSASSPLGHVDQGSKLGIFG